MLNANLAMAAAPIITTIGGGAVGDNTPAIQAYVKPQAVATDAAGILYIADGNNRIRRVAPNGVITTIAGDGQATYRGDNGPATQASLNNPQGLAVDRQGNIFVADTGNNVIRKIATNGIITTVAGSGQAGFYDGGGNLLSAQFNQPAGLTLDASGNLYIVDRVNQRIRLLFDGVLVTVAGSGINCGAGGAGTGDGGPAVNASLCNPNGVAVAADNSVYIADTGANRIRHVGRDGIITTVVGDGNAAQSGDGGAAVNAEVYWPSAVVTNPDGSYYIAEQASTTVRRVNVDGVITRVAGVVHLGQGYGIKNDGGPALDAYFLAPKGLARDTAGNLYIADASVRRVDAVTQIITTFAGNESCNSPQDGVSAGNAGAAVYATLCGPGAVAVDASGNVYVAEFNTIQKIDTRGTVTTVIGGGSTAAYVGAKATDINLFDVGALAVDAQQNLYVGSANYVIKVSAAGQLTTVFNGNGGPTVSFYPSSMAVDLNGNIYFTNGNRVQKLDTGSQLSTIAGSDATGNSGDGGPANAATFNQPSGIAIDRNGRIFIADTLNGRVRVIDANSNISAYAGIGSASPNTSIVLNGNQTALTAALGWPQSLALDTSNNLYINDLLAHQIFRVDALGYITSVAGNGSQYISGDEGPTTTAGLGQPRGVAATANGTLYIGDYASGRIRRVASTFPAQIVGAETGIDPNRFLSATIQVSSADIGRTGNLYIAALLPDNQLFELTPSGWISFDGSTVLPFVSNIALGTQAVAILNGSMDVSAFIGTSIFAGYGMNSADLLNNHKYALIYTIQ